MEKSFITLGPAGKGLTACLFRALVLCVVSIFPFGVRGQVVYWIELIPDLCVLPTFIRRDTEG